MKTLKFYAFLTFLFLGSTSVSAQSMLDLYFGGNKEILMTEAAKLINTPETALLRTYSYRANRSMTPDDYVGGLNAVNNSMLVIIGSEDEVFSAKATEEAIRKHSKGEIRVIDGATHNGVRHNPHSFAYIKEWFLKL